MDRKEPQEEIREIPSFSENYDPGLCGHIKRQGALREIEKPGNQCIYPKPPITDSSSTVGIVQSEDSSVHLEAWVVF